MKLIFFSVLCVSIILCSEIVTYDPTTNIVKGDQETEKGKRDEKFQFSEGSVAFTQKKTEDLPEGSAATYNLKTIKVPNTPEAKKILRDFVQNVEPEIPGMKAKALQVINGDAQNPQGTGGTGATA